MSYAPSEQMVIRKNVKYITSLDCYTRYNVHNTTHWVGNDWHNIDTLYPLHYCTLLL